MYTSMIMCIESYKMCHSSVMFAHEIVCMVVSQSLEDLNMTCSHMYTFSFVQLVWVSIAYKPENIDKKQNVQNTK